MTIAVLTPSYRNDFGSFRRLHHSVLQHTGPDVEHHVIVPRRDLPLFRSLSSPRLVLHEEADFLPASFIMTDAVADLVRRVPFLPAKARIKAINRRAPWPPVRGWILQQLVKLEAASRLDVDVVVIIDSDVVLIRPIGDDTFVRAGSVRLYRDPTGVTADMDRHVRWAAASRQLLGLEPSGALPESDYIAGLVTWEPRLVRDCLARVESVAGAPWQTVIGSQLHFSEFMLYGTFVNALGDSSDTSNVAPTTLCHSHWDPSPLDLASARVFVEELGAGDVAVHVQSNSQTSAEVRDFIYDRVAAL